MRGPERKRDEPDHGIKNISEYLGTPWSGERFRIYINVVNYMKLSSM
ncbi:hypothetical protein Igag_0147 [Ignisphaera aggregans DSM 17230]|uniref:Uncharacterized protein n=1 Tax=Ignisphaera aggregans (strain DSM 17230 / JCM 13409 / AQ1.S1) TaxID=583356 RepID=E0SPX6_IGNAA|nr:hypothetical protein Igag_0147 [Ignisphaera aggregans DSM 17230]